MVAQFPRATRPWLLPGLVLVLFFAVSACGRAKVEPTLKRGACAGDSSNPDCVAVDSSSSTVNAPAVSGSSPTSDPTPTWSWTAGGGGNGTFRYKLDSSDLTTGATESTSTSFTPASALSDGDHALYVQERDAAGNWSASGSSLINVDSTAPAAFAVTGPVTPGNIAAPTVTWSAATDALSVTYVLQIASDSACSAGNVTQTYPVPPAVLTGASQSLTTLADGTWYACLVAIDAAGNSTSASNSGYSFVIDTTAPTAPSVTGTTPTNDTTPTWSWTAGGGGNGNFRYKLDSSDLTTGATETTATSFTPASALSDGDHTLYVQERDDAGSWSSSGSRLIKVDVTAPTVVITSDLDPGPASVASMILTFTFSEAVTGFDASDISVTNATKGTFTATSATVYTLAITATGSSISANISADAAIDIVGNGNTPATQWSISYAAITGTSAQLTATSPERKTFFDGTRHWAFWYSGSGVNYGYGTSGVSYAQAATTLSINSTRFTVSHKSGKVMIAYESGFDIKVLRGAISGTSITWETVLTALDGSSAADAFSRPAMTVGSDDRLYVAAFHWTGANGVFSPKVARSTGAYSASLSWSAPSVAGTPTGTPSGLALVPQGSHAMAIVNAGGPSQSFAFDGSSWVQKAGTVGDWWSFVGDAALYGTVNALAVNGADVYVGGDFTTAGGVVVNGVAKWDGSAWSALGSGVNGIVNALAFRGADLYVGGLFTSAGGVVVNAVAKWDGSAWSALGSGVNGIVNALAFSGADLYVGGEFTTVGGVAAFCIAKWNGSEWSDLGGVVNNRVHAVAVSGSDIYVGGEFTWGVLKWDGSSWSGLGSGVNDGVFALAVSGGGELYVGGSFTSANGQSASRIAMWDGSTWLPLGSGVNGPVYALSVNGTDDLYAGGAFTSAGGNPANGIAVWAGGWAALGVGVSNSVRALAVIGTDLYVGGHFVEAGGVNAYGFAKWNGSAWPGIGNGLNGLVTALAAMGPDLYVGGRFASVGGVAAANIAKWNGSTWSTLGSGVNNTVRALAVSGTDLYVGGGFTSAGGIAVNYIAKWDGEDWSPLLGGLNHGVNALAVSGTDLYVGGWFTSAGGAAASNIAKWNGSTWSTLGSGVNSVVFALAVSGTDFYVGGGFDSAGGAAASCIAKWDTLTSAWANLGSGVNSYVYAIAVSGTDVYAGGQFSSAGGVAAPLIAKFSGSAWSALGTGLSGDSVKALLVNGSDVFVGGYFNLAGGVATSNIAKWSGSAWSTLGSGHAGVIYALALSNSSVFSGGLAGVSGYLDNLVASASSISATSDSAGVQLAYVARSNSLPYFMTFNGTSWNTPTALGASALGGPISLATSADSSQWLVAWERGGQIEYRKYSSSTWGSVTAASTGTDNWFPTLPELISGSVVPVLWTKGTASPYQLGSAAVTFP